MLLYSTKRANVDQRVISLDLLAKLCNKKRDYIKEVKCLASIIQLKHCLLPDLWIRLGESYKCINCKVDDGALEASKDSFPQFAIKPHYVILCCFLRALTLLKTVEASSVSYSSNANTKAQANLNSDIQNLIIKKEISEDMLPFVTAQMSKDIYNRYNNSESTQKGTFT